MYVPLKDVTDRGTVEKLYKNCYADETFVSILEEGDLPATKAVQGSNSCHIGFELIPESGYAVVVAAIDNLVKGASGQAVQNMNVMLGISEGAGLSTPGLFP
jgi:N-acetyl-gamma-glutamyl-phosphate reductase